ADLAAAGMVDEHQVADAHLPEIIAGLEVAYAVPADRGLRGGGEVIDAALSGFGLGQPECHGVLPRTWMGEAAQFATAGPARKAFVSLCNHSWSLQPFHVGLRIFENVWPGQRGCRLRSGRLMEREYVQEVGRYILDRAGQSGAGEGGQQPGGPSRAGSYTPGRGARRQRRGQHSPLGGWCASP